MLKFLFWGLLLANGGWLAYQQGLLGSLMSDGREPQRLLHQLNADKVRLLSPAEVSPLLAPSAAATAVSAPAVAKAELIACTEIGNFSPSDAARFEEQIAVLALGDRQARRNIKEAASHMVYIPSQGSKEAAEKKAGELRRRGVTDYFIIPDNPALRWGISLGVFKTEEAAKNQLAKLNQQGVHSARIGVRSISGSKMMFQLRNLDAASKARLDQIKVNFPSQEVHSCT